MTPLSRTRALGTLVALGLPLVLVSAVPAASAATPGGAFAEAYGVLADTTLLAGNVPVNIGPLAPSASSCPPAGPMKTAQLVGVPASPVVTAGVLNTGGATSCTTPTRAMASAQTLKAKVLEVATPVTITTDEITSTADVSCTAAPTASTKILNLAVGGTVVPLPTDIPPNFDLLPQVFGPLGLRVILNEEHPDASGRGVVVNGLHVIASATGSTIPVGGSVIRGDVIVSHASAGVVCPGGPGSATGGLPASDITFTKAATPTSIHAGDTVTYTATSKNVSQVPCEVLKFIDHVAPPFTLVSSAGPLGTALDNPAPARTDGGLDAVLRPTGVTIAPGASVVQTFTVKAKADAAPGTYYDSLEIYCGRNGNFASGPLAPVTISDVVAPPVVKPPAPKPPVATLPTTGGAPMVAGAALLLMMAGFGTRQLRSRS